MGAFGCRTLETQKKAAQLTIRKFCLKQTLLVMGKTVFDGYLPNTPLVEVNTGLHFFSV